MNSIITVKLPLLHHACNKMKDIKMLLKLNTNSIHERPNLCNNS